MSLSDIERTIREALEAREKEAWLRDVYGSYVIYEKDSKFFKLAYSILDGDVQFASEPKEVETVWVETRSQQAEGDEGVTAFARMDKALNPEGTAWDVTVCEPGFTKNGWYHPEEVLRAGASMFEGVDVNIYELPKGATHIPDSLFDVKRLLIKNKAGWLENVRCVAGGSIRAVLRFLDSYKWVGKNLLAAMDQGTRAYGLSYDAPARAARAVVEGRSVIKLLKFHSIDSVDIVTRPAAGGKFNRAVAAQKEAVMDKQQLWDLISKARPDLLKGKEVDSVSDEEITELARMAMEPVADPGGGNGGGGQPDQDPLQQRKNHTINYQAY